MPRARYRFASDPSLHPVFEAKLASSGLSLEHAKTLQLEALSVAEVKRLGTWTESRAAIRLPYFDIDGSPLLDRPRADPFFRLRYLGEDASFAAAAGAEKPKRYVQPPMTRPCAYLPPLIDWSTEMASTESLIITEGELKAAKACAEGFPTVGLGGVWSFQSAKLGMAFDPVLERFNWVRRKVFLIFDSDLHTNPNVARALSALAEELERRGAFAYLVCLPEVLGRGEKVGLDDFLVYHGAVAGDELLKVLQRGEPLGMARPLLDFNERYVYVANPGMVIDRKTLAKYKPGALSEHLASTQNVYVQTLMPDGSMKVERMSAALKWLKWPLRTEVHQLTYAPGKSRFVRNGLASFNTWPGWGIEPRKGSVKPFLKLIDRLFADGEPWAKDWFLRWLAYPLQHPGTKMFTSCLLHGLVHGSGKSLVGYTMGRIYGENFTVIKQKNLESDFNEWAENKQFVLGDDVTGTDNRQHTDALKTLITQEKIRINVKHVPTYTMPDCLNYLFTSNQVDAFFLEDDDRRHFIHEVTAPRMTPADVVEYVTWRDGGGPAALFDYFLKLDLGDFNPTAPAPATVAKERMIAEGRSDLGTWVRDLLADPASKLKVGGSALDRDLFTATELLVLYDAAGRTRVSVNGLARELRRAGAPVVNKGLPIRTADGLVRLYALRNADRWRGAKPAEVAEHRAGKDRKAKY